MNWCAIKPRAKPTLDMTGCCGTARRDNTITIDVPEVAKQKLIISTDNMFTIGSVCIDRRGFHWKGPEDEGANASSSSRDITLPWGIGGGGADPADEWRRGSRNYLEAKRGLRESGKASFGALLPNLSDLTTLTVRRKYARSVRLEDVVKIKGISECLGKGVSGTVWKVRDKSVDETLALKEMAMDATDEAKNQTLVNEMRIMLELDHPSIVACHGVFYELGMFKIIMEYCDAGSLLDVMRLGDHTIPADALAGMMLQVLEAMAYLHTEKRVIHRDVKPGNILLNRQGQCKLADFGVCSKPRDTRDSTCATWVGTVTYMSPERIKGNSYSFSADVWALGVIVVEATLGRYPYLADPADGFDKSKFEFWDLLYSLDDPNAPCATKKLPPDTDKNLVSFAQYVLDKDNETRASSTDALNHPFIAAAKGSGDRMLQRISMWINKTLQGPRAMDAKTIDSALGNLHLAKPPLAPTAVGTRHPPVERDSARVNVGSLDHPRPPSTVVTPRKDLKEELKDDSAAKKPPVIVPSSSRSTPRNNANAAADTGAPPPSANGTGSSTNISAKVMNGNDVNANGRKSLEVNDTTSSLNGKAALAFPSPRMNSPRISPRISSPRGSLEMARRIKSTQKNPLISAVGGDV